MKKKVMILTHDYWHHSDTILPLMPLLFPNEEWEMIYTTDPNILLDYSKTPDLFVSFKDAIENDQIPTPIWCDDQWTDSLEKKIKKEGMNLLVIHAGVTDIPIDHKMTTEILRSHFVNHPKKCPVSFVPTQKHMITKGIEEFTYPMNDEQYVMEFDKNSPTDILGYTISQNGKQPALWIHHLEKGKVGCLTPGHYTENLTYPPFVQLMKNMIQWLMDKDY